MMPAILLLRPTDHIFYEDAKAIFLALVPLPQDVLHVVFGLMALFLSVVLLRRSSASFSALALGLAMSLAMEFFDLYDSNLMVSRFDWLESLRDLLTTNLIPVAIVWFNRRPPHAEPDRRSPSPGG